MDPEANWTRTAWRRVGVLCIMVLAPFLAAALGEEPPKDAVFKMPADRNLFFRSYCYTGSSYVEFARDGRYRRIEREHMFVEVVDTGTWTQSETGEITLKSKQRRFPLRHVTPMTYRRVTFLVWKDTEMEMNRDPIAIKQAIDQRKGKEPVGYAYVEIDRKTFEYESGTTQEFIFYPEMNKRRVQK